MLTTIDDVIYEANLINIAEEEVISVHLDSAAMVVKRLVGEGFYGILESEKAANTLRFLEVKKAETNYAVSFVLVSLNIISTGTGIVTRFDSSKSGEYNLKPEQVIKLAEHYKTVAERFIFPYLAGNEQNPLTGVGSITQDSINEINRRISSI